MTTPNFMKESVVQYACSCGLLNPISKLFFCRHCPKLRCSFCVCHEVDSHFCSNCLENIPSSEVRHKKNCCANCFDCPSCQYTLSARATTVIIPKKSDEGVSVVPNKECEGESSKSVDKTRTKKMYYLSCLNCRWTSRDVGIPDQTVATGGWPENECAYLTRFNMLCEYYQSIVQQDKQERNEYLRRKVPKIHKFPSLTDRTGLTVSIIRRQMGWPDKLSKIKPVTIKPSEPIEVLDELPDNIFTDKLNLEKITTIKQRHNQPCDQPLTVDKLYPQRRCMWIKRSLRCRQCEHNVIKPEYHPTSIKYRIQLFASYHIPEVLLVTSEQALQSGKRCSVILRLRNPTIHDMVIRLENLPTLEEELKTIAEFKRLNISKDTQSLSCSTTMDSLKSLTGSPNMSGSSLIRQNSIYEEPRVVKQIINSHFEQPESEFILNLRDDAKEFDDDLQTPREEPTFILWRKSNKVKIRIYFTPHDNLQDGDKVYLGFNLLYTYVNTVCNIPEKKEPTKHNLNCRVYIMVGCIRNKI